MDKPSSTPLRIGHRGVSGVWFENSLQAFRAARPAGLDGVELDVHATRDGAIVVHHDPEISGLGPIGRADLRAIRAVRLPNGEAIPTLAEALEALAGLRVYVEVKALEARHDRALLGLLAQDPAPDRLAVHSFDHRIVARLVRVAPRLHGGILSVSYPVDPAAELLAAGAVAYWMEASMVDRELVETIHGAGGQVIAWTVNDRAQARALAGLGVDGLCGNYPDRLVVG